MTFHFGNRALGGRAYSPLIWPRAIILLDMNAFFASIEQLDRPELRGQPVAVTNGKQGTCIITCSYEARAYGIKTGMRMREAQQRCSALIQCPARPERYAEVSTRIMEALFTITPDLEVFSVDEAFLDVSHCQQLHGTPIRIGHMAQQIVFETAGVLCSVGVSGDKTTAKYAAKLQKPNGFNVIPPWEAKARLQDVPVTELCGIAEGIGRFLASYGAYTCGEVAQLPISILAKRFGNIGRRIWYMCQGQDPEPIHTSVAAPKSMGHGKVMPPNTTEPDVVWNFLQHMSEKLATRLRRHQLEAQHFAAGLRSYEYGWLGGKGSTVVATNDSGTIYRLARQIIQQHWHKCAVCQVHVVAVDPKPMQQQLDLFIQQDARLYLRNQVIDAVNDRFGEFTVGPARLLNRSRMPNVIAPAWKPYGHRQTIVLNKQ